MRRTRTRKHRLWWPCARFARVQTTSTHRGIGEEPLLRRMTTIQKTKEFTVSLENKPGKLAELTRALASANVNILGIEAIPNGAQGDVRLLVNDATSMEQALLAKGLKFQAADVLSVRMPNRPGSLAEVSERLAKGGVDIQTVYGYAGHGPTGAAETDLVLKVQDVAQAERVLRQN